MDYLTGLSVSTKGKIRTQEHLNANFGQKSFTSLVLNNYKNFKVRVDDYSNLCLIGIKVNVAFAFAINKSDKALFLNFPLEFNDLPHSVYVSESDTDMVNDAKFLQACHLMADFLRANKPSSEEAVFVYRNRLNLVFRTDRDLKPILDQIIELLSTNNKIFKSTSRKVISIKSMPENLQPLAPFMKKYSIPDDSERDELIEGMKKTEIRKLVDQVDPYMEDINSYLNSFKDEPLSEEATLLGNLAELVTELKVNGKYS
jgi:hypothetical protein